MNKRKKWLKLQFDTECFELSALDLIAATRAIRFRVPLNMENVLIDMEIGKKDLEIKKCQMTSEWREFSIH